ncbi:MAG: pilus assembly protein [Rhodospirillales bacterium]|nr:pilus assembly protein [Rhodospirillales bacterium]
MTFNILPRQKNFTAALKCMLHHDDGIAATEFALILPILLLVLMGTIELTNALAAKRKLLNATQTAADLIGQETDVTSADLSTIYLAARLTMSPVTTTNMTVGVASVRFDDTTGDPTLDWSDGYGGGTVTDPLTKATGHGEAGASIIIVSATNVYSPLITLIIPTSFIMHETTYVRPRTVSYVMKN